MLKDYVEFKNYKRIPNTGNLYEMTTKGELRETFSKEPVTTRVTDTGETYVVCPGAWFDEFKLSVLLGITFRNVVLPPELWKELDVLYKDGDPSNYRLTNTIWKSPEGRLQNRLMPGFCYIPGYTRYLINRQGQVISAAKGDFLSPYEDANGYMMFGVQPDVGKRTIVGMHRLLALAFLYYTHNVDSLDVNHIDTMKANNVLPNLEWVSRQRNNKHAHENGLNNSQAVLVRDVITNEVTRYYSSEECGRVMGMSGGAIRLRAVSADGKVFAGLYQFKLEGDTTPWVIHESVDQYDHVLLAKPVYMESIKTGESLTFPSIKAAAHFFSVSHQVIQYQLSKSSTGVVYQDHLIRYL